MSSILDRFPYYYDSALDVDVVGLPFMQRASTMYIFLPRMSTPDKLFKLQSKITSGEMENIIDKMKASSKVAVSFPKMVLRSDYSLMNTFQAVGLTSIFDKDQSDLSLMEKPVSIKPKRQAPSAVESLDFLRKMFYPVKNKLHIEKLIHKVYISIDESGCEAAAATVAIGVGMFPEEIIDFVVETPFMFVIRHDPTKIALFSGLVIDPTKKQ